MDIRTVLSKKMIRKFKYFIPTPKDTNNELPTSKKYAAMPFITDFSHTVSKKLKNINENLQLAFRPCNKLQQRIFTNTKTPIDSLNKAGVVYKIECMGNSTYFHNLNENIRHFRFLCSWSRRQA
jgi:hypothetical protein